MTFTVRVGGWRGGDSERDGRRFLRETDEKVSVGKWTNDMKVKQMSKLRLT